MSARILGGLRREGNDLARMLLNDRPPPAEPPAPVYLSEIVDGILGEMRGEADAEAETRDATAQQQFEEAR